MTVSERTRSGLFGCLENLGREVAGHVIVVAELGETFSIVGECFSWQTH
jgi:hypothetical protein